MAATVPDAKQVILFAGGGTGGHLMPGLAVAQEIRRLRPDCASVFAGTSSALERRLVEGRGFIFHEIATMRFPTSPLGAPGWVFRSADGLMGAKKLIRKIGARLTVALGGHAAVAPAFASAYLNVPVVIMEQNAIPGKANRVLAWWAQEVYVPWPDAATHFPYVDRVHVTGNPVRRMLSGKARREASAAFGLDPMRPTLLVMGGSQGARAINRAVAGALPTLKRLPNPPQIIHSTGQLSFDETRRAYDECGFSACVRPFIDDMAAAYRASDVALCRAGGTTLAELGAAGVAAVLVPYPHAKNDHQRKNASVFAGEGAALILDEVDLDAHTLTRTVSALLRNRSCLEGMRAASRRIGRPRAVEAVVERILTLLDRDAAAVVKSSRRIVAKGA